MSEEGKSMQVQLAQARATAQANYLYARAVVETVEGTRDFLLGKVAERLAADAAAEAVQTDALGYGRELVGALEAAAVELHTDVQSKAELLKTQLDAVVAMDGAIEKIAALADSVRAGDPQAVLKLEELKASLLARVPAKEGVS